MLPPSQQVLLCYSGCKYTRDSRKAKSDMCPQAVPSRVGKGRLSLVSQVRGWFLPSRPHSNQDVL